MSNRVTLDGLDQLGIGEIASLPIDQLAMLAEEAEAAVKEAAKRKEWLQGALHIRCAEAAQAARVAEGRTTGVVRLRDHDYEIICDLPKKPKWDQAKLQQAVRTIETWGSDPREYVELTIKVSETSYNAWPSEIRAIFEPARTLETGKATYRIVPARREAA